MAVHDLERIPVVADAGGRQLVGVASRSDLIGSTLLLHDEENVRLRFRCLGARVDQT